MFWTLLAHYQEVQSLYWTVAWYVGLLHVEEHWFLYYYCKYNTVECICWFNLLKPTGYVMHQQFNIQQLYALPTLYLCVLYLSENKQRLVPLTA